MWMTSTKEASVRSRLTSALVPWKYGSLGSSPKQTEQSPLHQSRGVLLFTSSIGSLIWAQMCCTCDARQAGDPPPDVSGSMGSKTVSNHVESASSLVVVVLQESWTFNKYSVIKS